MIRNFLDQTRRRQSPWHIARGSGAYIWTDVCQKL